MGQNGRYYKGVIFDLDGTLINTLDDLADSVNEALAGMGYPVWPAEAYRLKVGRGFRNLMENSVPEEVKAEDAVIDEMLRRFLEAYDRRYLEKSRPYEGIDGLLDRLVSEGVQVAVNSNKRTDYTEKLIQKFFPRIPFAGVFGERKGVPKKPDPASALELCGIMGLAPGDVLYIGDSKTDIQTGKNASMDTVGVTWGFRGYEELHENGAVYIAWTAEDIHKAVQGLFRKN
ncbi:HAD family hydrolase [Lacrimispora sp. NSJ-141]|uniref:HAD family hydrolase n=1 Tax=Lientehia hominis TaxID=2897778 RepID=A0AAP2RLK9_9FIRM|nr:HAD family hydrolase [Lientehia hominis]MCD2493335.1 HAD family hydrolase [Lientehia hominis]